jgi:hypothetical protein
MAYVVRSLREVGKTQVRHLSVCRDLSFWLTGTSLRPHAHHVASREFSGVLCKQVRQREVPDCDVRYLQNFEPRLTYTEPRTRLKTCERRLLLSKHPEVLSTGCNARAFLPNACTKSATRNQRCGWAFRGRTFLEVPCSTCFAESSGT